jgi:two-component system, cell cycle sensor histidine kinase and response regulator CckA
VPYLYSGPKWELYLGGRPEQIIPILRKLRAEETKWSIPSQNRSVQSRDMSAAAEFSWMPPDSETELHLAFDHAPIGLAQCRANGEIIRLNPALEQMFGHSFTMGRSVYFGDLLHLDDKVTGERLLREVFSGKRNSFQIDSRNPVADDRPVRWTAWRVEHGKASCNHALVLAEQIRENNCDDSQVRQAHGLEAVGRLAGGVAHDFNNLLTGVLLYCDLLMAGLSPGDRTHKYVEEIRNAGMQATGLVRQLLSVARPTDAGIRQLSLNEVIEGMRGLLLRLIGENIKLDFHLDPNLGLIKMDHTQAQQILLNLVLNARDAMPAGGQIKIETGNCRIQVVGGSVLEDGGQTSLPCVLFAIEDNGSGMDAATRARAFEPFFTTKGGQGTGIGLATVHDIVTSNGGLIHIDSLSKRGTRVSVLLPVVPADTASSQNTNHALPERNEGVLPIIEE